MKISWCNWVTRRNLLTAGFSALFFLLVCTFGCKDSQDDIEPAPILPPYPADIYIEYQSDPEAMGFDDHLCWKGKAKMLVTFTVQDKMVGGGEVHFLEGSGSGTHFDIIITIDPPEWIENIVHYEFTADVWGGYMTDDSVFFTLTTENSKVNFDMVYDNGVEIQYWPWHYDEISAILSDFTFKISRDVDDVFIRYDTTLLYTAYKVQMEWITSGSKQ